MKETSNVKILFIHVGTHKTGTTSLQFLMKKYQNLISENGIYIPKSGIVLPSFNGHHNLAWELNEDARFNSKYGTVSDMIKEISSINQNKALLSSEDFEFLYCKPERLTQLKCLTENIGYVVYIIIFFRDIISYISSMYAEFIKQGYYIPQKEYINEILSTGKFKWKDSVFCFEYQKIFKAFADVFGENNVIINKYSKKIEDKFFKILNIKIPNKEEIVLNPGLEIKKAKKLLIYNKTIRKLNLVDTPIIKYIEQLTLGIKHSFLAILPKDYTNNIIKNQKKYVIPSELIKKINIKFHSTIEWLENI